MLYSSPSLRFSAEEGIRVNRAERGILVEKQSDLETTEQCSTSVLLHVSMSHFLIF